ncbi:MAG: hypothetical protein V2I74_10840 [Erythrobacter sp.]|nr:hypothetical protein [Erythrobacter sp.]
MMRTTLVTAAGVLAVLAIPASTMAATMQAQESVGQVVDEDSEERLDEALKKFGYLAGLAQTCVADEQKAALEREVLELNGSLARLLGVDRAFLFSAAYGYGSSVEVETKDCAEVLETYEARVARHRAAAGGTK